MAVTNNYVTNEYLASILDQYRQTSPQKASEQNGQQSAADGEHVRRQVSESLFRTIDDSFDHHIRQLASLRRPDVASTPNVVQQMVRTPVITSDSFVLNKQLPKFNPSPQKYSSPSWVDPIRAQYSGPSPSRFGSRPSGNTYRARVIDYSNGIIERPRVIDYTHGSEPRSDLSSVLTERNVNPMYSQTRSAQSVNALHSAISSIGQKPFVPKPILKNQTFKGSPQILSQSSPSFNTMTMSPIQPTAANAPLNPRPLTAGNNNDSFSQIQDINGNFSIDQCLKAYEIIRTKDADNNPTFYCHHCNVYIKKVEKLRKHCSLDFHQINVKKTLIDSLENPLNKKFIWGRIESNKRLESIGLKTDTVFRMELDRISVERKHHYLKCGIRLKNPGGSDVYYCKYCEDSISSLNNIESHISSESHRHYQKRPTLSKFVSLSVQPILGLEFVNEYKSDDLKDPIYECSLCRAVEDPYDMFIHVCSFRHKLNLLKKINPNELILNSVRESPQAVKEINRRISELAATMATVANYKTVIPSKAKIKELQDIKTGRPEIEVIDITDDDVTQMSKVKNCLAVRVTNSEQAAKLSRVIDAVKEEVVKYFLNKIPEDMRRVLITKVLDQQVIDIDTH